MMLQSTPEQAFFHSLMEEFYKQISSSNPLQRARARAWDHFAEKGLPNRQNEAFKYVRLKGFYNQKLSPAKITEVVPHALQSAIYPECADSVLVFVNGHFSPHLSRTEALPKRLVLCPLHDAVHPYGAFLNNQWIQSLKDETDPFAILNAALHPEGAFIYLPPKTVVEAPIQILNIINDEGASMWIMPRLLLFAGAQSELQLFSNHVTQTGRPYALNMAVEIAIEEEAHVRYTQNNWISSASAWHFEALRATLKRNSTLKTVAITNGSATTRHDYRVTLKGENAEALLNGVWMLDSKREAHTHVVVDHQAPHCRSLQLFKGVLNDVSHSSFEGKILVRKLAQKTEAFQLNHNLLLSDHAAAESKPNLEIFADDVKASHGSTVGKLDDEQLFYLRSRGFSHRLAQNALVRSFCQEVLGQVELPSFSRLINGYTQSYLSEV